MTPARIRGRVNGDGPFDVLITGAEERQGLNIIRSLGRAGIRVLAGGSSARSMGFLSKYATGTLWYPSPYDDKRAMSMALLDAVRAYAIPLVLPVTESTVIALDEYRDLFPPDVRLAIAPRETLHIALDKRRIARLAMDLGIPTLPTVHPGSAAEAIAFAEKVGFPLVIKPAAQRIYSDATSDFEFKVEYFFSAPEFAAAMRDFETRGEFPLVQKFFVGEKRGVCIFAAGGRIHGLYVFRPAREYPYTGGLTSVHQSVAKDPNLVAWTEQIVARLDWDGVAMIEYRTNPATGESILLEMNPRFAGVAGAGVQLGFDFPLAYYRYLVDGTLMPLPADYPANVQCRYFRGDVEGLWRIVNGTTTPGVVPLPSLPRALLNFFSGFDPRLQSEIMDVGDPLPGLADMGAVVKEYSREAAALVARRLHLTPVLKRILRRQRPT